MATMQCDAHPYRRVFDTLVVGYLNRQSYSESARCLVNESPDLRNILRLSGPSLPINDIVHGRHLEQIMQIFIERGHFDVGQTLLDFGNRLRSLANEFTALTNADMHWSDAQRTLYGKHVPPSKSNSNEGPHSLAQVTMCTKSGTASKSMPYIGTSNAHAVGCGSTSTRRKSAHPVSIDTRRKEMLKGMVEPVVHSAQQLIDGAASSESSSSQTASSIPIDDSAVGTLERYIARDNLEDIIASIERDMPPTFFDDAQLCENFDAMDPIFLPDQNTNTSWRCSKMQQVSEVDNDAISNATNLLNIPLSEQPSSLRTIESSEHPTSLPAPRLMAPSKNNPLVNQSKLQPIMWSELSSSSSESIEMRTDKNTNHSSTDSIRPSHCISNCHTSDVTIDTDMELRRKAGTSKADPVGHGSSDVLPNEKWVTAGGMGCSSGAGIVLQTQGPCFSGRLDFEGGGIGTAKCEKTGICFRKGALRKTVAEKEMRQCIDGERSGGNIRARGQCSRYKRNQESGLNVAYPEEGPLTNEGSEQIRKRLREERWSKEKEEFENWKRKNDEEMMRIRDEDNRKESEGRVRAQLQQQQDIYRPEEEKGTTGRENGRGEGAERLMKGMDKQKENAENKKRNEDRRKHEAEKAAIKGKEKRDEVKRKVEKDDRDVLEESVGKMDEENHSENVGGLGEAEGRFGKDTEEKAKRKERKKIEQERRLKEETERRKEEEKRVRMELEEEKRVKEERNRPRQEKEERLGKVEEERKKEGEDRIRQEEEECPRNADEKRVKEKENRIWREEEEHRKKAEEKRVSEEQDRIQQEEEERHRKGKDEEERRLREEGEKKMKEEERREREKAERLEEEKRKADEELCRRTEETQKKEAAEVPRKEEEELAMAKKEKCRSGEEVQEQAEDRRKKEQEGMHGGQEEELLGIEHMLELEEELRKQAVERNKKAEEEKPKNEQEELARIEEEKDKVKEEQKPLRKGAVEEGFVEEAHSVGLRTSEYHILAPQQCEDEGLYVKDDEHISSSSASLAATDGSPLSWQRSDYVEEKESQFQKREAMAKEKARECIVKKRKKNAGVSQTDTKVDKKERRLNEEQRLKMSKEKTSGEKEDKAKEVVDNEKKRKDRGERLRKEQEEVQKQLREQAEKEKKRAIEREKRRQEEKEDSEREERERRRREKEEREEREKRRKAKELREHQHQSKERSPKEKKQRDREKSKEPGHRSGAEDKEERKKLRETYGSKEKPRTTSEGHIDLSYLFEEGSNSPDSSSKRMKPKTRAPLEVPKENIKRRSGVSVPAADNSKGTKEPEKGTKRPDKRSASVARSKGVSRSNLFLDDLFSTFMAPPPKPGTSCKEPSPAAEVSPKKVVASGVNKGRENLLVGGGHSARVGMVLEKATRIRAKFEHEERVRNEGKALLARASMVHDIAQSSASTLQSDYIDNRKTVEGYLKSYGSKMGATSPNVRQSEKEPCHSRKRILDLPIPKTVSLDLVGEILAPKQTQIERYVPSKAAPSASPLLTASSSPRTSHTAHHDPSTSSLESTYALRNSPSVGSCYSQLNESMISSAPNESIKKPRLDGSAINNVLNALHNWRH